MATKFDPKTSLTGGSASYLEDLYTAFQQNPSELDDSWRDFFGSMDTFATTAAGEGHEPAMMPDTPPAGTDAELQNRVSRLIQAYRTHGHKYAWLNPLGEPPQKGVDLQLSSFGLGEEHMEQTFATDGVLEQPYGKLSDILAALEQTYTSTIGIQYNEIPRGERIWLRRKMESLQNCPTFSKEEKKRIWQGLMVAESFERFLHTKFVGMKRFSGEGADSLIPMLDMLLSMGGDFGVTDIVMGMAHRGRLNVLANILDKPFKEIFAAFEDSLEVQDDFSSGDVKYHMGKSYDVVSNNGHNIHVSLLNNPSHLEAVNPVVEGSVRAKQTLHKDEEGLSVLPLLIHGDSAFAGQGIVTETLNMAALEGFSTGGTMHIVINNQLGYTAEPNETFSGEYCTDVARMLQVPIFHVNGDDPEACVHAMKLAMAWRREFKKDVVIDLVCYRKYGHNEGDDPSFTQPLMYDKIKGHQPPVKPYRKALIENDVFSEDDAKKAENEYHDRLSKALDKVRKDGASVKPDMFGGEWQSLSSTSDKEPATAISTKRLDQIAKGLANYPSGFTLHSKVGKFMDQRHNMLKGEEALNWGAAEMAAYASLLAEGYSVRITGQDVQRGTFSHRHAALVDAKTGERIFPARNLATKDAHFEVHNSHLSELAVVGFEFGYSLAAPKTLTIWEAQFGDFSNGAQIIIDQFISSSQTKWHRFSGLVMLLPHGFEGQGPEHSSARMERYLQLCAEDNMTVANLTTPAQIFHILRRQMLRDFRKPLIIMTPKSLLRHPKAVSSAEELTDGGFEALIKDPAVKAGDVKRVVLCSGKLYYDLLKKQEESGRKDVALVRLEQLHPLPLEEIQNLPKAYKKATEWVWAQEEPRNQGAWTYLLDNLQPHLSLQLNYVGRPPAASPAVGSAGRHAKEQARIVDEIFA